MKLSHFFLPHPKTHKKAHLISWKAFIFYIVFFVFLQIGLKTLDTVKPGVLGINSSIDQKQLIQLTNDERAKYNLPALAENSLLDQAALAKAQNMFAEDYWAHYAPSGKDPWGFITGAGYKFSYAGENLARNFYTSSDVVSAWMASPSHKENMINPKYKEIGIAVAEGVLKGQKTTLVVQEFGTPIQVAAFKPDETINNQTSSLQNSKTATLPINRVPSVAGAKEHPESFVLDPYLIMKTSGMSVLLVILSLIILDLLILQKRGVTKVTARHLPHMALLALGASALITMHPGSIL